MRRKFGVSILREAFCSREVRPPRACTYLRPAISVIALLGNLIFSQASDYSHYVLTHHADIGFSS